MQSTQEINWWLETAKIVIPVAATFVVGYWITRSNEKYKTELAKQIQRFQNLHPKRIAGLEMFLQQVRVIEDRLKLAIRMIEDVSYYLGNDEHLLSDLSPVAQEASSLVSKLDKSFDDIKIFMNQEICEKAEDLIKNLRSAASSFITHYDEETDKSWIPAKDMSEKLNETKNIVQKTIPKLKNQFEEISRKIISD